MSPSQLHTACRLRWAQAVHHCSGGCLDSCAWRTGAVAAAASSGPHMLLSQQCHARCMHRARCPCPSDAYFIVAPLMLTLASLFNLPWPQLRRRLCQLPQGSAAAQPPGECSSAWSVAMAVGSTSVGLALHPPVGRLAAAAAVVVVAGARHCCQLPLPAVAPCAAPHAHAPHRMALKTACMVSLHRRRR